ncbi:MAG: sigma-54 dependent transcriptional regulator [Methylobacillus sp.]|jgi:DNA-binding NtrC family response regulator|nr:sigma-54 dependent transcriptional regulator [Methylobacillus sp.]
MTARQVLVVDDEVGIRELLSDILSDEGYQVRLAENAAQARDWRQQERPDLVLLDIWMPDCDGITLLKEWGNGGLLTMPVVMMSGHGTIDTAVEATRIGAFDFLEKPIALQKLLKTVNAALKHVEHQPRSDVNLLSLCKSVAISELRARLEQLDSLKVPLLLAGARGCGAELCARFLHRQNTPWLELTQPEKLATAPLEILEQYREGLIYIPEVADLGKTEQKGLQLLLAKAEKYDVRIVCATTQSLSKLVQAGQFDETLYHTLSAASLAIPALAEHREDIPDLAKAMATFLAESGEANYKEFDVAALNAMRNADWLGNMAQLKAAVKNLMLTSIDEKITLAEAQRVLGQIAEPEEPKTPAAPVLPINLDTSLREARDAFERIYFEHHIAKAGGNMSRVAEAVELERTHLYRKLKQLNIRAKQ